MLHSCITHGGTRYGELLFVGVDSGGSNRLNRATLILDFRHGYYWPMSTYDALEMIFGKPEINVYEDLGTVRLIVTVSLTKPLVNPMGFVVAKAAHIARIIAQQIPFEQYQEPHRCTWDDAGGPEYYAFHGQLDAYERHKAHCDCYK